jgi:hypothetical protein
LELVTLRHFRRVLSAAVSLSAIALVMAKVGASEGRGSGVGTIASLALLVSLVLLVVVWRKEHAANEAAFAERERQQLAALELLLNTKECNRKTGSREEMQQEDEKTGSSS